MIEIVHEVHDISKTGVLKYSLYIPEVVIVITMIINNLTGTTYTWSEVFSLVMRTSRSPWINSITLNLEVHWGGKS